MPEKLDEEVAKLQVLASGLHSVLRRVGVVHHRPLTQNGFIRPGPKSSGDIVSSSTVSLRSVSVILRFTYYKYSCSHRCQLCLPTTASEMVLMMSGFRRQCKNLDGILPNLLKTIVTESLVLVLRGAAVLYQTSTEATTESEHAVRQFTELYADLHAFPREGGPQISVLCSHLGSGHYFYGPLYLTVDSLVLLLREECKQEDILGNGFQILFSHSASCLVQKQIQFRHGAHCTAVLLHSFPIARELLEGNKACEKRECFLGDKEPKAP